MIKSSEPKTTDDRLHKMLDATLESNSRKVQLLLRSWVPSTLPNTFVSRPTRLILRSLGLTACRGLTSVRRNSSSFAFDLSPGFNLLPWTSALKSHTAPLCFSRLSAFRISGTPRPDFIARTLTLRGPVRFSFEVFARYASTDTVLVLES